MPICTSFSTINHQSPVISDIKNAKNLPFSEILPKKEVACYIEVNDCRERVFSSEITLWAFLSQVLSEDKSQQAAVSRVIAATIAQGKRPPSANTAAYSKARSRLPEQALATMTRETAKQVISSTPRLGYGEANV